MVEEHQVEVYWSTNRREKPEEPQNGKEDETQDHGPAGPPSSSALGYCWLDRLVDQLPARVTSISWQLLSSLELLQEVRWPFRVCGDLRKFTSTAATLKGGRKRRQKKAKEKLATKVHQFPKEKISNASISISYFTGCNLALVGQKLLDTKTRGIIDYDSILLNV